MHLLGDTIAKISNKIKNTKSCIQVTKQEIEEMTANVPSTLPYFLVGSY